MGNDTSTSRERAAVRQSTSLRDWVVVYLKGIAMGVADSIPGISGGTIALITGIYERLIRAITQLDPAVLRLAPRLHRRDGRKQLRGDLREMDALFLVVLGIGVATAVVSVSRVAEIALEMYRGPTFAFFFGLIAASAVVLADRRWLATTGRIGAAAVGFLFAFLVAGAAAEGLLPNSLPVVFVAGTVAITGMILPGISGAFILVMLGQYDYMVGTLNSFIDGLIEAAGGSITGQLTRDAIVVATFLAGGFVGLFTVAYAVRWSLDRYRGATLAFLISLMVGALRFPAIEIATETDQLTLGSAVPVTAAAIVGAAAVLLLDHYSADLAAGTDG